MVGNAVSRDNPEVVELAQAGLPYCSMPQAVNHFLARDREICLICGTHGKTTTSALLAWILETAGRDPSFFIGGVTRDFGVNARRGRGPEVVVEGDEYDTAFFDKGPKFLHYTPRACVVTSLEFDHADIYRDLAHVESAFDRLMDRVPADSLLVVWDGAPSAARLARDRSCRVAFYGHRPESDWRLGEVSVIPPRTEFEVIHDQRPFGRFATGLMGRHNLLNALACVAVAHDLGVDSRSLALALDSFRGARRRQEIRGVADGVTVMDDFAHHPTAVRETIRAVRPHWSDGRLIAVFEPRTNTSMRRVFQSEYAEVFDEADQICIRQPSRLDKVPEAERFSSTGLVADLRRRGKDAHHFENADGIIDLLADTARNGDLVLIMSNGGFDGIHGRLLAALRKRSSKGPEDRREFLESGT